jgi:DNA-binding response OmpR family regulator
VLLLLLVHDADARRQLALALQERAAMVETAATGAQAVNKAILIAPDAVVIDTDAPEAEEAAARLKRSLVTRRIPLVQLAGATGGADTHVPTSSSYEARLPRECDPEELLATIRRIRAGRRTD